MWLRMLSLASMEHGMEAVPESFLKPWYEGQMLGGRAKMESDSHSQSERIHLHRCWPFTHPLPTQESRLCVLHQALHLLQALIAVFRAGVGWPHVAWTRRGSLCINLRRLWGVFFYPKNKESQSQRERLEGRGGEPLYWNFKNIPWTSWDRHVFLLRPQILFPNCCYSKEGSEAMSLVCFLIL